MGRVGFVFLVLALVACGAPAATPVPTVTPTVPPTPTPGCAPDAVVAFLAELDTILTEWDDANELAHSTARMSLPAQIESLQAIRRKAATLDAPCAEAATVRDAAAEHMGLVVDGFMLFLKQESDGTVESKFGESRRALDRFGRAYAELKERIP